LYIAAKIKIYLEEHTRWWSIAKSTAIVL